MKLDNIIAKRPTKTIYRDGDKLIKLFNGGYDKADVLNEALNQSRVEKTELNIPKISEVTKIDGKWAIISDFIEGTTLAEYMKKCPERKQEMLEAFVNLQITVHEQRVPLLNKMKDALTRKIFQTNLAATTRFELQTRLEAMPKHKKVCHCDFNPSNIIITKDGTLYIIDWAHVTQGNASADAAVTYMEFILSGDENTAKEYLEMFCEKTDTQKRYIEEWLPITAAARMAKGISDEYELLENWVNVAEFD